MSKRPPRVVSAEVLKGYTVSLRFSDGESRTVDLEPLLRGPIFAEIRTQPEVFAQLYVDDELGTIVWPNGADVDPDVLYGLVEPVWRSTLDR